MEELRISSDRHKQQEQSTATLLELLMTESDAIGLFVRKLTTDLSEKNDNLY